METDSLLKRLQALEDAEKSRQRKADFDTIMGSYGDEFSGNEDFGYALVDELHNRGVDMSAADSVVKEILDELRQEVSSAAEMLRVQINRVNDLQEKAQDIQEAVVAAEAKTGEGVDDATPMAAETEAPAPDMGAEPTTPEAPAPDMGAAPAPDMSAEMPAPDMGAEAPVPEAPAPDMGAQLPPGVALSDARLKKIKGIVSSRRPQKVSAPAQVSDGFKPSSFASILGGF